MGHPLHDTDITFVTDDTRLVVISLRYVCHNQAAAMANCCSQPLPVVVGLLISTKMNGLVVERPSKVFWDAYLERFGELWHGRINRPMEWVWITECEINVVIQRTGLP